MSPFIINRGLGIYRAVRAHLNVSLNNNPVSGIYIGERPYIGVPAQIQICQLCEGGQRRDVDYLVIIKVEVFEVSQGSQR